jgi:PAS domain S-box-containing protein
MKRDNAKVEIDIELLAGIMPFVLVTDENLAATWASRAIMKRLQNAVGTKASELLKFRDCSEKISDVLLNKNIGKLCKLTLLNKDSEIPLFGRWLRSGNGFVLLAMPDAKTSEELSQFSMDDFSEQDHLIDLLVAREETFFSLKEAASAASALKSRNRELESAKQQLESANATLENEIAERKQAEEELKKTLQWQQGVNLLRQSLLAPSPLKDKLKTITDSIVHLFEADFCRIWLIRPGDICRDCVHNEVTEGPHICRYRDKCLHLIASSGRYIHTDGKTHRRVPFGCYKIGRVASGEDHKFLTNNVQNDPRVHNHEWAKELGLVSFAGYQLRVPGGDILGVLALFAKHPIVPAKDAMLDGISSTVAFVVQQAVADNALRASEQKYKTLLENLPQKIFLKDKNLIYLSGNENYAQDLEIKPEEIAGKTDYDFHPKELAEKYRTDDKRIMESGKVEEIEEKYIRGGKEFIVQTVKTPIKDEQGNAIGILGIFWDITELKKAQEKQTELLKQLEDVNQELKDFAYIVSHDLKAPLRGIKNLAEWISTDYADKLDDNGKEQMNLLASRVDQMHNLIDGILLYSRVGRVEEEKVVVNLNELVPEVIDTLAPPENITITIENELPTIECGQTRIMQVFQNLMSNAVEYMDKPQGQIKVGCVEEDGFWEFYVADNGPGIEEKYFEKIFQLFQTLAPRDESESTGVGLTIIKKIVEMYGGKTWVQSKVGSGSTFFFTLPKALSVTNNEKQLLVSSR